MIMTNIDHHDISVLRKLDGIDYCEFHYHGIMITSIYVCIAQLSLNLFRCPNHPDVF